MATQNALQKAILAAPDVGSCVVEAARKHVPGSAKICRAKRPCRAACPVAAQPRRKVESSENVLQLLAAWEGPGQDYLRLILHAPNP